jgi:hypothetical protein
MNKDFVPYQESLELKELGFNEKCYGYYTKNQEYFYFDVDDLSSAYTKNMDNLVVNSIDRLECTAPIFSQAFRWLLENYGLYPLLYIIKPFNDPEEKYPEEVWIGQVCQSDKKQFVNTDNGLAINHFETREEAELECLRKLIEIVKNKQ